MKKERFSEGKAKLIWEACHLMNTFRLVFVEVHVIVLIF